MNADNVNQFSCVCGSVFAHASSLSLHRNGSVKKNIRPCSGYYEYVQKDYNEKWENRTLTMKDVNKVHDLSLNIIAYLNELKKKEEEEKETPKFELVKYLSVFPPPHVQKETIVEKFLKKRKDDFIIWLFTACYLDTEDGREHCVVILPKVGRIDVEYYDGKNWRCSKTHIVLGKFVSKVYDFLQDLLEEKEADQQYVSTFERFDAWYPNEDELFAGQKVECDDDDGERKTYNYGGFKKNFIGILEGSNRDEIKKIKRFHARQK